MYNIIKKYISNLTKDDIYKFAYKNKIYLSNTELDFLYYFIKNNYEEILKNPNNFNIDEYAYKFNADNYIKIKKVFNEYFNKYKNYL